MITKQLDDLPIWNDALPLPMVTDDSDLFEYQILLGGISLVLSRLHPQQGKNRFTYTRGLAVKLSRLLEHACGSDAPLEPDEMARLRPGSAHLAQALAECERTLDTGTLIVFRSLQIQALKDEKASAAKAENDSKFGVSVSGALEPARQVQTR
jgi:hypothetical protein